MITYVKHCFIICRNNSINRVVMRDAPRSGVKEPVQIRLPSEVVEEIDELIRTGQFSSRSDFIYRLVINYMDAGHEEMIDRLNDPTIRAKIQEICKETFKDLFS